MTIIQMFQLNSNNAYIYKINYQVSAQIIYLLELA